jgi:hypothetical protein
MRLGGALSDLIGNGVRRIPIRAKDQRRSDIRMGAKSSELLEVHLLVRSNLAPAVRSGHNLGVRDRRRSSLLHRRPVR